MATGDRETTLILKAADLSSQTIQTVVAALGRLLEFQEKFNQQAATGSIRTSEFRGNLAELQKVFVALAQQKLAFPEFDRLTAQLDRYTSRLDFLRLKARDLATIPEGERTRQQQRQLDRLTDTDLTPTGQPKGTIARAELARDRVEERYERQKALLQSMGADVNNLVESEKLLDQAIQHATDGLLQAGAAQRELIPGIVKAREEQQALNEAARQLKAINEAAAASARQQATAIKEATSQAAVFDTAARKAFDAVERGLDKAKGEQFLLSFGDASAEDRQRTEAKLKASRDAAEAEKNAYLVARSEADDENRRRDLATVEARKAEEKKAADAFDIAYASAHDDERRRIKTENEERIKADKLAADKFLLSYSEAIYEKQQREKAARQAQDASDLEASRRKIADFEARRPAPQPYGQASPGVSDFSAASQGQAGASQAVRSILEPQETARQTFVGLQAQIQSISETLDVKGHKSVKDLHEAARQLLGDFIELKRQAATLDLFQQSEQSLKRTARAMLEAHDRLQVLNEQVTAAGGKDETLNRALEAQRRLVTSTTNAYNVSSDTFAKYKGSMDAAGLSTTNLSAQQAKFVESANLAVATLTKLNDATGKGKSRFRFLGLEDYELANLGYQINDVFSQFAQGQHVGQIFADQAGQIFQLWERDIGKGLYALRQMPLALAGIGVAAVAATVGVAALVRALDIAAERRALLAQAAASVDPTLGVSQFDAMAKSVAHLGVSYTEAGEAIRGLSQQGLSTDRIRQLVTVSALFSQAFGKTFAESSKEIGSALHGTYDELIKFTSQWKLLRADQAEAIRAAYEAGDLQKAYALAIEFITPRLVEAREKGTSPLTKAWVDLKNAALSALDAIGDSPVWPYLINRITDLVNLLKTIAGPVEKVLDALQRYGVGGLLPGTTNVPPSERAKSAAGPTEATSLPAPGQEAVRDLRDQAADLAGVNRDAFRRLFDGEAKFRDGQWRDAERINKDTGQFETIPDGGKGIMQIVQSTFDRLKKDFPDLIKGDVHDLTSNLVASAIYFRQMLEQAGGSGPTQLARGMLAYKEGPLGLDPSFIPRNVGAREKTQKDAEGFQGTALTSPTLDLDKAKQSVDGLGKSVEKTTAATQTGTIATKDWAEQEDRRTAEMARTGLTAEETQTKLDAAIRSSNKAVADSAAEYAKSHAPIDQAEIERVQYERRKRIFQEYFDAQLGKEQELDRMREEISNRAADKDKTNLYVRLRGVADFYNVRRDQVNRAEREGAFNRAGYEGPTAEQTRAQVNQAEHDELNRTRVEVAKATFDSVFSAQRDALKEIANDIGKEGVKGSDVVARARQEVASRAPARAAAQQAAEAALEGVTETEEVKSLRARFKSEAAIAARPPELRSLTEAAARSTQQEATGLSGQRSAEIDTEIARVKSGSISFQDGLKEVASNLATNLPELRKRVDATNDELRRLIATPGTSDAQIAEYKKQIAENELKVAKAPEEVIKFITEGLADGQANLDRLVKEYEDLIKHAAELQKNGMLAAAKEARDKAASLLPEIGTARIKQVGDLRAAAATPGLPPGEVASLNQRATAADREGDTHSLNLDTLRGQAKQTLGDLNSVMSDLRERQSTEQALLAKGLTTQTAFEEENKRAFEDANTAAAPLIESLQKLVADMEAAGASAPEIAKITDQIKLLQANLQYIPPLQQQIITGLEQSFVSRGEQAFDAIAKAIAIAITQHGKLKDVIASVGQAFANFAAGVLQDIAKIIIKYELLKLIKDALGIDPNDPAFNAAGGGGGGAGSGAGGGAGAAGGILGLIGKLFGGGAGAGAGAAGAFDGAGVELGAGAAGAFDAAGVGAASAFDAALPLLGLLHTGGEVTSARPDMSRRVDLSLFNEARRMHTGGIVGLSSDEVPAILQKGETVMTKAQMAMKKTQEGMTAGGPSFRNVLAVGDKEIASAMNSSHGEKVVLNMLRRNAPTIKQIVS